MKNIWPLTTFVLVAVLLAQAVLPHHAATASVAPDRLENVQKTGVLRCGYIDYPPYFQMDPNTHQPHGIMVDVMKEFETVSGLKVQWTYESTWGTIPADLNQGKFDAYCANVWLNTRRASEAVATEPFGYAPLSLYRYRNTDKTPENGTYIAIDGTFEANILQRLAGNRLRSLPGTTSFSEELQSLAQGKADYALIEEYIVTEYNAHNPGTPIIKVAKGQTHYVPLVIMVPKGQRGLADFLNAALSEMRSTGSAQEIQARYNTPQKTAYLLDAPR